MNGILIKWIDKTAGTYDVIKFNATWPALDLDLPLGNDLPYEWFMPFVANNIPEYDSRLWILNENIGPSELAHPEHPVHKQWRTEYSLSKRTNEEIIDSIRQAEANANFSLEQSSDPIKANALWRTAMEKLVKNQEITESDQGALNRANEVTVKVGKNAENAKILIAQVMLGIEPNIDYGWEYDNLTAQVYPLENV
jgi:hypothetical protein